MLPRILICSQCSDKNCADGQSTKRNFLKIEFHFFIEIVLPTIIKHRPHAEDANILRLKP